MGQEVGGNVIVVGDGNAGSVKTSTVLVTVNVGANSTRGRLEGKEVGVGGKGVAAVSASDNEMPPITNKSESMAMITPPPI
jgi:hypothetical protein